MMRDEESIGDGRGGPRDGREVIAWRLGRVELGIEEVVRRLDLYNELKDQVQLNTYDIKSLIKSRDRLMIAVTGLATGIGMLAFQQIFGVVGK